MTKKRSEKQSMGRRTGQVREPTSTKTVDRPRRGGQERTMVDKYGRKWKWNEVEGEWTQVQNHAGPGYGFYVRGKVPKRKVRRLQPAFGNPRRRTKKL